MDPPTIGIIGGGQLAVMLIEYGIKRIASVQPVRVKVLDPCKYLVCSCSGLKDVEVIKGSLSDENDLRELCKGCDVVTWEIEHVDVESLRKLKSEGVNFVPDPEVLGIIQNKGTQKLFYQQNGIPTLPFCITDKPRRQWDLLSENEPIFKCDSFEEIWVVYKDVVQGYDGHGIQIVGRKPKKHGVTIIKPNDVQDQMVVVEPYVPDKHEYSVLVAVDASGNTVTYEPVEMTFHPFRNILKECFPATSLEEETEEQLITTAKDVAQALGSPGLYAVEMFVAPGYGVVVNETAPRVHNSGHHTIHSHNVSQFEMFARLILGRLVCQPQRHSNYVMRNLLGSPNPLDEGAYHFRNRRVVLPDSGPFLIDYRKANQFPWRKLGHITHISKDSSVWELRHELQLYCDGISLECGESIQIQISIVMGSRSDWSVMKQACELLDQCGIDYETTVVSAHRTPDRLVKYAKSAHERGIRVIIAGAGGAAHLPGMLAANTTVPVIGVPIASQHSPTPHAALWSIVQMPPGVPVACMAINGAKNAALFALQLLGEHSIVARLRKESANHVILHHANIH